MDDETFESSLDRFGTDLDRWPDALAAAARTWVERSLRARDLLREARELDAALDGLWPAATAPLGLETRILANLPERTACFEWLTINIWRPAALALAPLVVGFGVGLNVAHSAVAADDATEDDVLLALFDPEELARLELPDPDTAEQP